MTSKASHNEVFTRTEDSSNKRIIKGYQKREIPLKKQDLNLKSIRFMRVKRLEVKAMNFGENSHHSAHGDMKILGKMSKSMRRVENLSFNFGRQSKVTEQGLGEISKRIRMLRRLRSISFSLEKCEEITNEGITKFCQGLEKVGRLRTLHISFLEWMTYGKFDIAVINEIYDTLKRLKCLKNLKLCFKDGRYVYLNMELANLEKSLRMLSSLESLYLDFGIISKLDCARLCRILEEQKRNICLRNFALGFGKFSVINDGVLESLSQILPEFIHLESLKLSFYKCFDITNKRVEILSQALESLKCLKSLALNFQDCGRIDDSGVEAICLGFKNMTCLKRIKLKFPQCNGITDETVENLEKALNYFPQLESIHVILTGCPKISLSAKENIQQALDALSYIKNKTVSF